MNSLKIHFLSLLLFLISGIVQAQNISIGNSQTQDISTDTQWDDLVVKNGGTLIIRDGATLTIGSPGNPAGTIVADFQNGSFITIEAGGSLIIYGALNNSNNSDNITINGDLYVDGNFTGGNGSSIGGSGTFDASGSITTSGSGSVFGSTDDCNSGPCSGNSLCGITNNITSGNVTICNGTGTTVTADVPTGGSGTFTYQWESSTTSPSTGFSVASGTTSNQNYSTTSISNDTWYRRRVLDDAGCNSLSSTVKITINTDPTDGTWTGFGLNSNWNNADNWCVSIPTSVTDVTIGAATQYPVINATADANSITIDAAGTLTISGTNTLNVYGDWTNNGSFTPNSGTVNFTGSAAQDIFGTNTFKNLSVNNSSGVSISSGTTTVEGLISLNGTLNTNGLLTLDLSNDGMIEGPSAASGTDGISGNLTVKRTFTGNFPDWHYIGTPFGNTASIYEYSDDYSFIYNGLGTYYYYNETVKSSDKNVGFKPYTGPLGTFGGASLSGIAIYQTQASITLDITSTYDHYASYNDIQLSLTPYTTGTVDPLVSEESDGWHLIGNPYPSPIDWDVIYAASSNLSASVYVYNNSISGIGYYNSGDQVGMDGPIIPAMQSFFVQTIDLAANDADRYISIDYNSRSTSSQAFYRKVNFPKVRIKLESGEYFDETLIRFIDEASDFFDPEYDAIKFEVSEPAPYLCSRIGQKDYAINSVSELLYGIKEIPLVTKISKNGNYTFTVSDFENIDPSFAIYLEDLKTGKVYNVRNNPVISFSALSTDPEERFILSFRPETITSSNPVHSASDVRFINAGAKRIGLEFADLQSSQVEVMVCDMMGREVYNNPALEINSYTGQINLSKGGMYIVKVQYDNHLVTETVLVAE